MPDKKAYYQLPVPVGPEPRPPAPPFPLPLPPPASPDPAPVEIEYPSSDGQPMAENDKQANAMVDLFGPLRARYAPAENVYVGIDLLIYYQRGDKERKVAPDVFVVRGVPKRSRDTYQIWEEGKAPDFVLEVASPSTAGYDAEDKMDLYARLGVREYWLYDPKGGLPKPRLQGYALSGAKYRRLRGRKRAGVKVAVWSRVLDLELRFEADRLRLWDPAAKEYLLTLEEEKAARQQAESEREEEKAARQQAEIRAEAAEQRVAELEAALKAARQPREPPD